jgi:hypothetical protein
MKRFGLLALMSVLVLDITYFVSCGGGGGGTAEVAAIPGKYSSPSQAAYPAGL